MADLHTLQQVQPPGGGMDKPVTWRDLMQLQANLTGAYDPVVKFLTDRAAALATLTTDVDSISGNLALYQLRSEKDAASGYAGLDSSTQVPNARVKWDAPSAIGGTTPQAGKFTLVDVTGAAPGTPVKGRLYENLVPRAWVNFKDVAGTITVNANVNCTVGFRTGTAAGDYVLTLTTAEPDAFWAVVGTANDSTGGTQMILAGNPTNPSHTASVFNFVTFSRGAGANTRPTDCMLIVFGN